MAAAAAAATANRGPDVCAQCMATAATAAGAATGLRAWLATRGYSWLTPDRLRRMTVLLLVAAFTAAATLSGG